ncbi:MAG: hypothetical protein KatS3mg036_0580 [Ignavibacterium sp.]|nr:MAG: hypothetical protein KatS3mg036_0580 [Ignavibacterium sp.]
MLSPVTQKLFDSKGGKVVLDEFAFHSDAVALWKAAKPVITWGFPLRILSTHKGKQSLFYKFIESIKSGKLNWSLHTTTIFDAVEQGLVDKIYKRKTTKEEREAWLKEQEENSFDRTTWLEEYCCTPVDEATAFLSYEQIFSIERDGLFDDVILSEAKNLYIGVDIGRKKDLTVIWIAEEVENFLFTRKVIELERTPFKSQKEILFTYFSPCPAFVVPALMQPALGMQLAEEAQDRFGQLPC